MIFLFRLITVLLLAAPVLAAPAMWRVDGGQGNGKRAQITLYGTVHALPPGQEWFTTAARTAFITADQLVVEVANSGDPAVMAAAVQLLGMLPQPVPLASRLPPALQARLIKTMETIGIPAGGLDRLKTWLAAISILGADLERSGIDPAAGVDRSLIDMAAAAGKPIHGLETAEFQLGIFDALPETEQRLLLGSVVTDAGAAQDQLRALLKAWLEGDVERIRIEFDDGSLSSELEAALLTRRNAAWADWVVARIAQPGQVFVAVGAAHMAGQGSLIALLQARGLTVKRVE